MHYFFICSSGGLCQETSGRKMKRKCLRFVAFSFFSRPNNSIVLYRVYQGFRLNIGTKSKMIIFGSFLTTFDVINNFGVASLSYKIGWRPKPNHQSLTKSLIHTAACSVGNINRESTRRQNARWLNNSEIESRTSGTILPRPLTQMPFLLSCPDYFLEFPQINLAQTFSGPLKFSCV